MPDQSRARLHKAIAAVIRRVPPRSSVLNHYNAWFLQLDPRCGEKTKSGWSAICVTATDGTCPAHGRHGDGDRHCLIKIPRSPPTFSGETREICCAANRRRNRRRSSKTPHSGPMWDLSEFRSVMRNGWHGDVAASRQFIRSPQCRRSTRVVRLPQRQQALGFQTPGRRTGGRAGRQASASTTTTTPYCWARAQVNERYQDHDATASGVKRYEELAGGQRVIQARCLLGDQLVAGCFRWGW